MDWNELLKPLLPVLATAITAAVTAVLVQLFRRLGIDISTKQDAAVTVKAKEAVYRAEERGALLNLTPDEKMRAAIRDMLEQMPKLHPEDAKKKIESALPQVGLGACAKPEILPPAA